MPGTSVLDDIELIIEDIGGGGKPPAGRDGGDSGGDGARGPGGRSSARKTAIAISAAMLGILMFFMGRGGGFWGVGHRGPRWAAFQLPVLLWFNTAILLASSATLEVARKRQAAFDEEGFKRFWTVTTILGIIFVVG